MHFRVGTVPRQQCHVSNSATSAVPRKQQCHVSSATSAVPHRSQCHISSATSAVSRQQCHVSSATTATVPRQQQCHVGHSATSAVPRQQQCHVSSATTTLPRKQQCRVTVPRQQCPATMTGAALGMPGQLANESFADYKQRFQAQLALIEAEEQRQLAAQAARLQAEAAATAEKQRLQAEADADTQARRKEAQDLLQRHEAASIERQPELERQNQELQQQYQDLKTQHQELANLRRMVHSHEDATRALNSRVLDLEQVVPGPDAGESSSPPSNRQLEQRVDHVVAMLDDISTFAAPTTISNQLETLKTEVQQLQSTNTDGNNPKQYKMPTFQLEKFDDYTHQDQVLRWKAFTTQLRILPVAKHAYIGALFINSKGGCQIWLTHLAATHGVDIADLRDKITWGELTRLWKKRFIVDDAPSLAINRLFTMTQGNTATRDWLTEWQKIATTPDLDLPFPHLRREFYNRLPAYRLKQRQQLRSSGYRLKQTQIPRLAARRPRIYCNGMKPPASKDKFWHFEPSNGDDATPEEQHKEVLSKLMTLLLYACNYQQPELERQNQELQQQYQDLKTQHQELANLRRMVHSHEDATRALNSRVLDLEQVVPGPDAGESSSPPSNRQLEQRVDHVVAMLDDISTFAAPTTISNQLETLKTEVQQLQSTNTDGNNPKQYKMPTFQLEKFDDYTHQDPVLRWKAFTTQLSILPVAKHTYIGALFMNSKGGCQIWLTHLAATHGVDVADLRDKITWEELTRLSKKRFIIEMHHHLPSTVSSP
ncbi:hypothetical protein CBR_g27854 [Chara braunii]|uniref:Uncharacterized protein n=1 Tax=Chara braunii TaxID=69332 RepID=A0A388L8I6_CHABU|nr:hypothetical protein CBR_g27854 [Chara braunii]|eukprot:GBG78629.1 hypothetical protein CBR_g27854 [Chara braunii]